MAAGMSETALPARDGTQPGCEMDFTGRTAAYSKTSAKLNTEIP
jgi:hypothetical protein